MTRKHHAPRYDGLFPQPAPLDGHPDDQGWLAWEGLKSSKRYSPRQRITSTTHPYEVWSVSRMALTGYPGGLGIAAAPGRVAPRSQEGPTERDLAADLARLRDHHGCNHLVSLMEPWEMRDNGIEHLPAAASEAGVDCHLFPLVDLNPPTPQEYPAWDALVERMWRAVCQGDTVVAHCRGGRGRSGTFAASVLMRFGWSADEAVALLRVARPSAVDGAQMTFLRNR